MTGDDCYFTRFLKQRRDEGLLRALTPRNRNLIDFSGNDYLGLAAHPGLKQAVKEAVDSFGVGSGASRLLSGDSEIFHQLEEKTARFKGKPAALVFNSGYQANIGIISALCRNNGVIFLDKLSHASIIDGGFLSGAKFFRFRHNDCEHLQELLNKHRRKFKTALIITESIFSMDGDKAFLADIAGLKEEYDCLFMVDEAHATGIFGSNGAGLVEELGLSCRIDIIMGTFSKALGSFGAYVACSKELKEYFINSARSFIYSTALPPAIIAASNAAIDIVRQEPWRGKVLLDNAKYFRDGLLARGADVRGDSQIVPYIIGDNRQALELSGKLLQKGYWVPAVRPPTVHIGQARVRFSVTSNHSREVLDKLVNIFE